MSSGSYTSSGEKRYLDVIFSDIKDLLGDTKGNFYEIVKNNNIIIGGTTVIMDYMYNDLETAPVSDIENTNMTFFSNTSNCDKILDPLRDISLIGGNRILRERISQYSKCFYQKLGINEVFTFDLSEITEILIDTIEVVVVSDKYPLHYGLGIYGYDILTSYISFNDTKDITERKFISGYKQEIMSEKPVAKLMPHAAQAYYDNDRYSGTIRPNSIHRDAKYHLETIGFQLKHGEHKIDLDVIMEHQLLGIDGNGGISDSNYIKNFIVSHIAESIIYDNKKGFFNRGQHLRGISMDINPNREDIVASEFVPFLCSLYDYRDGTPPDLFELYTKAISYDYEEDMGSIWIDNYYSKNYKLVGNNTENNENNVSLNEYIKLRYFFDREYFRTLESEDEMNSYRRSCFINHVSVTLMYFLMEYTKKMNTPSSSQKTIYTQIYVFIRELLTKYTDEYIKCCLTKEEIPEEIHMGVGVEPQFEDFLDDDSYLNVKEFIDKDKVNHIILILEDGNILPINRKNLLDKLTNKTEDHLFFKCSSKFDNAEDPLAIGYSDVVFTEPYFDMKGSTQEIAIRVSELYSIVFCRGVNFFKLTKDKTVNRIAMVGSMFFNGTSISGGNVDLVGAFHCQSGIYKNIFRVNMANVTSYKEVERVVETRKILTIEDVFSKYPMAKELYDSDKSKIDKIRGASRLDMDGEYKTRLIQSITTQRSNIQPVESDSSSDEDDDIVPVSDESSSDESSSDREPNRSYILQPTRLDFEDQVVD